MVVMLQLTSTDTPDPGTEILSSEEREEGTMSRTALASGTIGCCLRPDELNQPQCTCRGVRGEG